VRFSEGFAAAWHGWRFLQKTPALWGLAVVPTLLAVLVSAIVFGLLLAASAGGWAGLHWLFAGGRSGWDWYAATAGAVVLALLFALVLALAALVLWKLLTTIICGYWFGRLAERAEQILGVVPGEIAPVSVGAEALGLVLSLSVLVAGSVALLLVGFVPVVGPLISLFGGIAFTSWMMGLDYLGFPLALRGYPRWRQYPLAWPFLGHVLGLGTFVSICELVPIVGALPLTMAVLGAVLLARKQQLSASQAGSVD
jgi:CysZ protein